MNYRFSAYEALLHLREAVGRFPNPGLLREIDEMTEQVQNRRFLVAVAGEFNRGKSSLINALLGMPVLPMDILPMTATASRIRYGLTPRARILRRDGTEQQIRIDELADYITKQTEASGRMAKTIRETVIEYPTMLCQGGLEILDTPGLNDTEEMSQITGTILREAHAVIFTVSALLPVSMTEVDWLAGILESERLEYLMFAVTFIDRVAMRDRQKVLDAIRTRIASAVQRRVAERWPDRPELAGKARRLTDPDTMFLMPVSASDALEAFDLGDDELLQQSNLPRFKLALTTALNAQQDEYALRRTAALMHRTEEWLTEADAQRAPLQEAQALALQCDEALRLLQEYRATVRQEESRICAGLERAVSRLPDAYGAMRDAAGAVIAQKQGTLRTNEDVHRALNEATAAAKKAAGDHYRQLWQGHLKRPFRKHAGIVLDAHEQLLLQCRALLGEVPQLRETASLARSLWHDMRASILPELPEAWSLDITGGLLKGMVAGGQHLAEGIGRAVGDATGYLEKRSSGFRKMKGKLDGLVQKSGIADRLGTLELPRLEILEGQLTTRDLYSAIEPMLSEGATALSRRWRKLPQIVGPQLHQAFVLTEELDTGTALHLALTQRKGEADTTVAHCRQMWEERLEGARASLARAADALNGAGCEEMTAQGDDRG